MSDAPIPSSLTGMALLKALEYAKGAELDRLFAEVGSDLAESTGLSAVGLSPIRDDPEALRLIVEFLATDVLDELALVAAIEPLVYRADEDTPASEVARLVVDAIKRLAWKARIKDRDAVVHEMRRLDEQRSSWAGPRYLSLDWAPRGVHSHLQRLSEDHAAEALDIENALSGRTDLRRAIEELIDAPQAWLAEASSDAWTVLAQLAAEHGSWERAERAFVTASDRPDAGAHRPSLLARASAMANARGANAEAAELLNKARALDADNPDVLLADASALEDPHEQLEILERAAPVTDRQRAAIEGQRALAHLSRGDLESAQRSTEQAREAAPDSPYVRELEPIVVLVGNVLRPPGEETDWRSLCEAAEVFLELRDELLGRERHREAAAMAARAAEAYTIAGEAGKAAQVLETISKDQGDSADHRTRIQLAQVAVRVRPDLVSSFLPSEVEGEAPRLLRASAEIQTGGDDALTHGLAELEQLLDSEDEPVRIQAALARLSASAESDQVTWSERAESVLSSSGEGPLAALLKAQHHIATGDLEAAEEALVGLQESPDALELLAEVAEKREDWPKAVTLLEALCEKAPSASRRLRHAEVLLRAGRDQDALAALTALRVDGDVPTPLRDRAFALSAQRAWDNGDFASVANIASHWLSVTHSPAAAWAQLHALLRISEYDQALAVAEENDLVPKTLEDARPLAYLYHRALPPADALARIAELSDLFDREDDYLEGLIILTGLGAGDELPPAVRERRQRTFDEFAERFPDSQMIQTYTAPETPEEIEAFFREHFSRDQEKLAELAEQVWRGEAPMAIIAAATHTEVSTICSRSERLALGYGDPTLNDLERADAAAAIGGPAVWDPAALVVVGGLGDPFTETVLEALPGSVVPLAVLEDADRAALGPFPDEGEEQVFATWDSREERPAVTIADAGWVARDRARAEGVLVLAQRLRDVPNTSATEPTKFDDVVKQTENQPALQSWAATYAVASRLDLPIYSDDRYIRAQARRDGLRSFGTIALLEALVERGRLTPDQYDDARRRLRASGAMGVPLSDEDLIRKAKDAGWEITESLRYALLDRAGWRELHTANRRHISFLRNVFAADPSKLAAWVARVLDAGRIVNPGLTLERHAFILLATAWAAEDAPFIQALIDALRAARFTLGYFSDPVPEAFRTLLRLGDPLGPVDRTALFALLIRRLAPQDQRWVMQAVRLR